jgi:hypothetical protein
MLLMIKAPMGWLLATGSAFAAAMLSKPPGIFLRMTATPGYAAVLTRIPSDKINDGRRVRALIPNVIGRSKYIRVGTLEPIMTPSIRDSRKRSYRNIANAYVRMIGSDHSRPLT